MIKFDIKKRSCDKSMTYLPNLVLFTSAVTLSAVSVADRYSIEVSAQQKTLTTIEAREQLLSNPRSIEMIQSIPAPGDDWRFQSELRELIKRAQSGDEDLTKLREQIQSRQNNVQSASTETTPEAETGSNAIAESEPLASNDGKNTLSAQSQEVETSNPVQQPSNLEAAVQSGEAPGSVIAEANETPNSIEKDANESLVGESTSDQPASIRSSDPVAVDSESSADSNEDTVLIAIPEPEKYKVSILPAESENTDKEPAIAEAVDVSLDTTQEAEPLATKNALETLSNAKQQTRKPALGPEGYGIQYAPSAESLALESEIEDANATIKQETSPKNASAPSTASSQSATTQSLVDALPPHVLKSFKGLDSMTDEEFLEFLINLEYLEQARKGDQLPEIAPILAPIPAPMDETKASPFIESDEEAETDAEMSAKESSIDSDADAPGVVEAPTDESNSTTSDTSTEKMTKPVISVQRQRISSQRLISANETELTTTVTTETTTTTTTTSVKSRSVTYMEMVDSFGELITVQEADGTVWQKIYVKETNDEGSNVWRDLWVQVKETGELIFENTKQALSSGATRIRNFFNSEKKVGQTISVEEAELDCGLCIPYTPDPLRSQLTEELKDIIRYTPADVRSLSGQPKLTRLHNDDCGLCIPYTPDPLRSMLSREMMDIIRWAPPAYLLKFTVTPFGIEPDLDPKRPPLVPDMKPVDPRSKFKRGAGDYEGRFREESNGPNQHFYVPIFDN